MKDLAIWHGYETNGGFQVVTRQMCHSEIHLEDEK